MLIAFIAGAKFYYLRNILHDYTDDKCLTILKELMAVMNKDSVILIDDMVLPNTGAHWQATQLDLALMTTLAAMERTERDWYSLLDKAGLKVNKVYQYTDQLNDSVIEVVPK